MGGMNDPDGQELSEMPEHGLTSCNPRFKGLMGAAIALTRPYMQPH